MKVLMGYPTRSEEAEVVLRMGVHPPRAEGVFAAEDVLELQAATDRIYVDRGVVDYAVNLVFATRDPGSFGMGDLSGLLQYGASPRASLGLVAAGRALALLRSRSYVLPQDVFDVAPDVLRHRLVLSYEALARDLTADHLLARILGTVPAPQVAPSMAPTAQHQGPAAHAPVAAALAAYGEGDAASAFAPASTTSSDAASAFGPPAVEPTPPPRPASSNGGGTHDPAPPA
jgi:MoxR-like ATPase